MSVSAGCLDLFEDKNVPQNGFRSSRPFNLAEIRKIVKNILQEFQFDGDVNLLARAVEYELKIQELTQQLQSIKQKLKNSSSNELANLRKQFEELSNNYRILYDYYERLQKENRLLKQKLETSSQTDNSELLKLKEELKKAKSEAENYRKKLNDAKQLLEQTRAVYSATVKELENRVKTLEKKLAQKDNE